MNNITDKYPKYVKLREDNPYRDGRVVCNGICVTTTDKVLIVNLAMMKKLDLIKDFIEEIDNV